MSEKNRLSFVTVKMFILMVALSCTNKQKMTREAIIGRYENRYEKYATHYVDLLTDSTYVHYYNNYNGDSLVNTGKWIISISEDNTEIGFHGWRSAGAYKNELCADGCLTFVSLIKGELLFNYDLPKETNFTKVNQE